MAKKLYGTDPDQVPTNADLGTIAYQDKDNLSVGTVDTTGDVGINTASGPTDLTIAHYGHGLGLGYEGATLPSLAGLYTSSSATYGQAYGSLIVKSRTDYAGYSIIFRTQSGEAARFNQSGNLAFPNGQGIDFSASQGSNASSSVLDDYEEGTWTPTLSGSSTTGSYTYSSRSGSYTKIGRAVHFVGSFTIGSVVTAAAGSWRVSGMPYSADTVADSGNRFNLSLYGVNFDSVNQHWIQGYFSGATYLQLIATRDGTSWTIMQPGDFSIGVGDIITVSGTYTAA